MSKVNASGYTPVNGVYVPSQTESTSEKQVADTKEVLTEESQAAATKAAEQTVEAGASYEKTEKTDTSGLYKINKMSKEDRAALVQQLQQDLENRKSQITNLVAQMLGKQSKTFAMTDDSIWKTLASGNFTVDAATKKQAQEDISENGYWGVKQTAQRMFDFASALAGDDVDKMKEMQKAMEKGYKMAEKTWGGELPQISQDTMAAANKLFEDYYASKNVTE